MMTSLLLSYMTNRDSRTRTCIKTEGLSALPVELCPDAQIALGIAYIGGHLCKRNIAERYFSPVLSDIHIYPKRKVCFDLRLHLHRICRIRQMAEDYVR